MMKFIENMIGLLAYGLIGFLFLKCAGLDFWQSVGYGMLFGNIMGVLNEIHSDLIKMLDKK